MLDPSHAETTRLLDNQLPRTLRPQLHCVARLSHVRVRARVHAPFESAEKKGGYHYSHRGKMVLLYDNSFTALFSTEVIDEINLVNNKEETCFDTCFELLPVKLFRSESVIAEVCFIQF